MFGDKSRSAWLEWMHVVGCAALTRRAGPVGVASVTIASYAGADLVGHWNG